MTRENLIICLVTVGASIIDSPCSSTVSNLPNLSKIPSPINLRIISMATITQEESIHADSYRLQASSDSQDETVLPQKVG
jgi:hypothetical protein